MDTTIDTLTIDIDSETGASLTNIDNLISKLDTLSDKLNTSTTKLNDFKSQVSTMPNVKSDVVDTGSTTKLATSTDTYTNDKTPFFGEGGGLDELGKKADKVTSKFGFLKVAIAEVGKRLIDLGKGAVNSVFTRLNNGLKKAIPDAKKLSATLRHAFSKSLAGSAKKFALAMLGIRSLFTALRSAVQEYLNYDVQLGDSLRNNWAVLGSLLAPILEKVIYLFGVAVAYIRAFIKALTGVDLVLRANRKSMKGFGDSAKKTLGSLAKFDDLNVITFPTSGGGGGGGLPPLTTPDVDTSGIEKFLDYIRRNDWYQLGYDIGQAFNRGLATIDFNWLLEKAKQWATNFADLLNGLTDGINWGYLGSKVAGGLNTLLGFVNTFFEKYDFDNLGKSLAEAVNNLVVDIDWVGAGKYLTNKLSAFVDVLNAFTKEFDFFEFGDRIAEGISGALDNLDFGKMAETLANSFEGIANTIDQAFQGIDWDSLAAKTNDFFNNMNLGDVGQAIGDALSSAFYSIGDYLEDVDWGELGRQIADFIKGINWGQLLEDVLYAIGEIILSLGDLLGGFIQGLFGEAWNSFVEWLQTNDLTTSMVDIFTNAFTTITDTWNGIVDFFSGLWDAIKTGVTTAIDFVTNVFATGWETIKSTWDTVSSYFQLIFDTIKTIFSVVGKVLSGDFQGAWDLIKGIVSKWSNFFSDIWGKIKNVFKTVGSWFGDKFGDAWNKIKSKFSGVSSFFRGVFNTIKDIFKKVGTTIGNAIGESFANVVNKIIGFAENTINKFIRAINKAIGVINDLPGVKISKLDEIRIPKLATGTNNVEAEGIYHLHKGEAVVPKKYNPAVNNKQYVENNREIINELRRLNDNVENQEQTTIVNVNNKETANETTKKKKRQTNIYGLVLNA